MFLICQLREPCLKIASLIEIAIIIFPAKKRKLDVKITNITDMDTMLFIISKQNSGNIVIIFNISCI